MNQRVFNFSAGPAVMPVSVLEEIARDMLCLPGAGASILEISHRSKPYEALHNEAIANLRKLLAIPDNYHVVFVQGGARLQFSMIPMNLLRGAGKPAEYVITGSWGKYALAEAQREGEVRVAWDGKATNYDRLPAPGELKLSPDAAYVHVTSNETIQGVQFPADVGLSGPPVVADLSSDFLSRPVPVEKYGLIYACAQKNAGPAGVTAVIVREDLAARGAESLPGMLNFRNYIKENSLYNTPPTFAVYALNLVTRWLLNDIGGLAKMEELNRKKAALLYEAVDQSGGYYRGHAQPAVRSQMNVTFRLPSEELEKKFLKETESQGLASLAGHRSVGGVRASIYNAMPIEGVQALAQFMADFRQRNG